MGASEFETMSYAADPNAAFVAAKQRAREEYGSRGYTGTIAEKGSFRAIDFRPAGKLPTLEQARDEVSRMFDVGDPRVDDKWGPAGCIEVAFTPPAGNKRRAFLFFGMASC